MPLNKKAGIVPWDLNLGDNNYQEEPWILKKDVSHHLSEERNCLYY